MTIFTGLLLLAVGFGLGLLTEAKPKPIPWRRVGETLWPPQLGEIALRWLMRRTTAVYRGYCGWRKEYQYSLEMDFSGEHGSVEAPPEQISTLAERLDKAYEQCERVGRGE